VRTLPNSTLTDGDSRDKNRVRAFSHKGTYPIQYFLRLFYQARYASAKQTSVDNYELETGHSNSMSAPQNITRILHSIKNTAMVSLVSIYKA